MNYIILGYGKMGRLIDAIMRENTTNNLLAVFEKAKNIENVLEVPLLNTLDDFTYALLNKVDIIFDFIGEESKNVLEYLFSNFKGLRVLSGSTGWRTEDLHPIILENQHIFLHSSNFSIGINLLKNILDTILSKFTTDEFDTNLLEYHHREKKDKPSGTALSIKSIFDKYGKPISINSVRAGYYPGIHTINFDSKYETITLEHRVRDRKVFAQGAVFAGYKLLKKTRGIYSFIDLLE